MSEELSPEERAVLQTLQTAFNLLPADKPEGRGQIAQYLDSVESDPETREWFHRWCKEQGFV